MNDLEQRLRDAFAGRAATTQIDRRSDLPPAHGGATAGQRSWPLIVGVAAAVVVITVVGLAVLVRSPADDVPASVPSTPSPTSPSTPAEILPEVFPALPADDPRNAEAVASYSGFVSYETTDAGRALVGQIGDNGRLIDPVTITVFADIDTIPLASPYDDGGEEVVVDGVTYTRYVLGSNPLRTALVHRGDTDVAIVGEDPEAFIAAAGGIPVTDIVLRPEGGVLFSVGDLPDGYQTIVPPSTFPTMSPRVDLTIGSDGDDTFGYLTTGRLSDLLLHAGSTPFRQVDIDGTTGWAEEPSGGGVGLIVWQVAPETWATVMGSDESVLELARDAVFVDEATWQATYDVTRPDDPRFAGATPVEPNMTNQQTSTAPSTTTVPSDTSVPSDSVTTGEPGTDDDVALAAVVSRDASGCWVAYGLGSWTPARLVVPDGVDQSGFGDGAVVIGEGRVTGAIEDADPRSAGPDMAMDAECADTTTTVEFTTVAQVADPTSSVPSPTEAATINFEQHWECGHGFTTSDASDQWAISIEPIAGNASQALGTTIELPDDRFAVTLVYGLALSAGHCDTERRPFAPAIVQLASWRIVAGTFTYPETSWTCDGSAASTQLVGAVVDTGTGELDLPTTTLRNTAFGCGPGWDD